LKYFEVQVKKLVLEEKSSVSFYNFIVSAVVLLLTFRKQIAAQMNAGDLKEKVAKLGRAGLLAYGLFNGITYTTFFFIAFLAFEKTGQNPANNLKACLGVSIFLLHLV